MRIHTRTIVGVLGWLFFIPLSAWILALLERKRIIGTEPYSFFAIIFILLLWALWIFGKQFSYWPITIKRVLLFVGYAALMSGLAYVGLFMAYFAVVFSFGE